MNVQDPVCGMDLGTPEEAEALGAEVVDRDGVRHWFCCPTCKAEFLARPP